MSRTSVSFDLLDERVRRWVWRQGWTSLKDIQENSIPVVLAGNSDVIISASTAGGKTEAAFLPVLTSILKNGTSSGYQVLYVSPLKALINDQYRRLSDMTNDLGIDVTPWHGDIPATIKTRSLKNHNGIVIITPESLESFLINRERFVRKVFSSLKYVVIDELHSFIGTERGKQLQSLLSRIEHVTCRHIPRIAMSATFSDYNAVKNFLRNDDSMPCSIPPQGKSDHEIRILVKEYVKTKNVDLTIPISVEIYNNLRGSNNLVFTNSRNTAEEFAVQLLDMCEKNSVPNEFRVHHSSISKSERESIERDLQRGEHPITALCTSTLELGVDIGKVKSIAQIGTALSVSGLRQRLGRSGRRNEPSILRVFSIEGSDGELSQNLRSALVQNIAIIELMREHKYETPCISQYHFSTLIQQILAVIAQFGGFYPKEGWLMLCLNGAFKNITSQLFLSVLKNLGSKNVITQLHTGQIIIGKRGEQILKSPDFYTSFATPDEYLVINQTNSDNIGNIQYNPQLGIGKIIILSGQRWIIQSIDEAMSTIYVKSSPSGGDAIFYGNSEDIDSIIVKKMLDIYKTNIDYPYLDDKTGAKDHLKYARNFFINNNLMNTPFVKSGENQYLFTWAGSKINRTIVIFAKHILKRNCHFNAFYISDIGQEDIRILSHYPCNNYDFMSVLQRNDKIFQKYDYLLSNELLDLEYINTYLDIPQAKYLLANLAEKILH